ncbi:MAG: hypothetical protein SFW09_21575 [Hyphomicrobiaceae bacterium]|nr:hypothetical protein [Hyphomicrobiaceae bacterium]
MTALRALLAALLLSPIMMSTGARAQGWSLPPADYKYQPAEACIDDPVRASKPLRPGGAVYALCEDQMALAAKAIEQARKEGKLLIVTVGAAWCPWCAALQRLMYGPEFFERKGDQIDYRKTFNHIEIGIATTYKGKNAIIPSGVAVERNLRARSGGVEIKSIPFIMVLDPTQPSRVIARNSMEISDLATGQQDMGRFRKLIQDAHAELKGQRRAAVR